MNNIVFINFTTDYPEKFTTGNTKMEYKAKGLVELGEQGVTINNASSTTSESKDIYGKSEKGIIYAMHSILWQTVQRLNH